MITAIDTNILIDVFTADPAFGEHSKAMLRTCIQEGAVIACDVVWTETATVFESTSSCLSAMDQLGIEFSALNCESSMQAAEAWRHYRQLGGKRDRIVADFLIGAHALIQCDRLLTRDRGFYRPYFKNLVILNPLPPSTLVL